MALSLRKNRLVRLQPVNKSAENALVLHEQDTAPPRALAPSVALESAGMNRQKASSADRHVCGPRLFSGLPRIALRADMDEGCIGPGRWFSGCMSLSAIRPAKVHEKPLLHDRTRGEPKSCDFNNGCSMPEGFSTLRRLERGAPAAGGVGPSGSRPQCGRRLPLHRLTPDVRETWAGAGRSPAAR